MAIGLSEKQQAIRTQGIGASEVARVLGLVPGAIDVYAAKTGEGEPFEGTTLTEFGQRIERVIGEAYLDRHVEEKIRIYTPGTIVYPQHSWALASPDRVVAPEGLGRPAREQWLRVLEIKTVFFSSAEYGEGADEIPERHLVQVAWQQEVCGVEDATLVALVNGDYREYPLKRDREMGGLLLQAVEKWWVDHVLARVPPPVDGSAAYTEYLRRRYPLDSGPMLDPSPEAEAIVARLREVKAATKEAKATEEEIANQLRALLGNAAGIQGLCTYRMQKGCTYTSTREPGRVLRLAKEKR